MSRRRKKPVTFESYQRQHRRAVLMERHHRRCHWCKRVCRDLRKANGPFPRDMATEDHIILKSDGGSDKLENLVLACHECNERRGNIDAGLFATIMRGFACTVPA